MAKFIVTSSRYLHGNDSVLTIEVEANSASVEVEQNVTPVLVFYGNNDDATDGEEEEVVVAAFHEWDYVIRESHAKEIRNESVVQKPPLVAL